MPWEGKPQNVTNGLEKQSFINKNHFCNGQMKDLHEFLLELLQEMDRCFIGDAQHKQDVGITVRGVPDSENAPICEATKIKCREQVRCTQCGWVDIRYVNMNTLVFHPKKCESDIHDLLKEFQEEHLLDAQAKCSECNNSGFLRKNIVLTEFPPLLLIKVERFTNDSLGNLHRLSEKVKIPPKIGFVDGANFSLNACCLHTGTPSSGHYRTFAHLQADQWVLYDDCQAPKFAKQGQALPYIEENAYLLMYQMMANDYNQLYVEKDKCIEAIAKQNVPYVALKGTECEVIQSEARQSSPLPMTSKESHLPSVASHKSPQQPMTPSKPLSTSKSQSRYQSPTQTIEVDRQKSILSGHDLRDELQDKRRTFIENVIINSNKVARTPFRYQPWFGDIQQQCGHVNVGDHCYIMSNSLQECHKTTVLTLESIEKVMASSSALYANYHMKLDKQKKQNGKKYGVKVKEYMFRAVLLSSEKVAQMGQKVGRTVYHVYLTDIGIVFEVQGLDLFALPAVEFLAEPYCERIDNIELVGQTVAENCAATFYGKVISIIGKSSFQIIKAFEYKEPRMINLIPALPTTMVKGNLYHSKSRLELPSCWKATKEKLHDDTQRKYFCTNSLCKGQLSVQGKKYIVIFDDNLKSVITEVEIANEQYFEYKLDVSHSCKLKHLRK